MRIGLEIGSRAKPPMMTSNGRDLLFEIQGLRQAWRRYEFNGGAFDRDYKRSKYAEAWQQVRNKLAMRIERVSQDDYWWTPPQHQETVGLLWEIAGILRKAVSPWWRLTATVTWHVVKELLYLGILVALLLSSRSNFETRVIALLVLIYNSISSEAGSLGLALNGIQVLMGDELKNVARSMKLKASVMDFKTSEQFGMGNLLTYIHLISCGLGSVIAIVALVGSLF
jgi:hypothetical protein